MTNRLVAGAAIALIAYSGVRAAPADGPEETTAATAKIADETSSGQNVSVQATVAALDTQYQAAVKANDAVTMDRILADDFVLVTGRGQAFKKGDLLKDARDKTTIYEHQEEEAGSQVVRVWGDTAVVTALLWIKGMRAGTAIDYKLWFSDTYVRTGGGWKYAFGQASIALPKAP